MSELILDPSLISELEKQDQKFLNTLQKNPIQISWAKIQSLCRRDGRSLKFKS
jgi:hypothetical protein